LKVSTKSKLSEEKKRGRMGKGGDDKRQRGPAREINPQNSQPEKEESSFEENCCEENCFEKKKDFCEKKIVVKKNCCEKIVSCFHV
jgi:hypothetical protein